jgi:Leucine-rich repeat (LRR) protein
MPAQDAAGRIKYLDASKNQLLSLQEISTQLQQLTSLQQLVLARNRLADISGLKLLLDLRVLNLARNKIHDLKPLEVCKTTGYSSCSVW